MVAATLKRAALACFTMIIGAAQTGVDRSISPARRDCTFPGTDSILPITIADFADGVASDGRGPYLNGKDGVIQSRAGREGGLVICVFDVKKRVCADTSEAMNNVRSFSVNLSKPVPGGGGTPLGTISSRMAGAILTQRGMIGDTVKNMMDIAIGKTDQAAMLSVSFRINGRSHLLQMGPQAHGHCMDASDGVAGKNLVHGNGTSTGTIHRVSPTKWAVDLPAGSVGRLFDFQAGVDHAVDKGLYYVHLHFEIGH